MNLIFLLITKSIIFKKFVRALGCDFVFYFGSITIDPEFLKYLAQCLMTCICNVVCPILFKCFVIGLLSEPKYWGDNECVCLFKLSLVCQNI